MATSPQTISERVSRAAGREFVGRREERELLGAAIEGRGAQVLIAFIHGPGGIGKTRLAETALAAAPVGTTLLRLDCREIEPTPGGMIGAISSALDAPGEPADIERLARRVRGAGRTVLAVDTYERLAILDPWMRQTLLPAMPDSLVTIVAGRDAPHPAWLTGAGWGGLVRQMRLGPLGRAESLAMLRSRGLGEVEAARVNAFARGHPLALELGASAARDAPGLAIEAGPPPVVIAHLLDAFVSDLPEPLLGTVEAVSTVRRVSEPILRAVLDRPDVRDAYEGLARLPFVERGRDGLVVHDLVRETVAEDLAGRDPEAHARYRRRAWRYLEARARRPRPDGLWELTADLIYLIRNPVLRAACFPAGSSEHTVEPAHPGDGPAILAIAAAHEAPGPAGLIGEWWERHPGDFSVARDAGGAVGAFVHTAEIAEVDDALLDRDPVARAWTAHLGRVPPREGDRVLTMRRWLGRESGEMLSPPVGSCWLDVKRVYMELRPRLSRLYSVMADLPALEPIFGPLGFAPVGDPVDVGGVAHQPVWLDFGEGSVDGWLARLVDAELDADEDAARAGPVAGGVERLSARERQVLALIADGLSDRAIGERLVISRKTAGRHVSNLFAKLGVHTRAQAARIAAEQGLTAPRA